MLYLEKGTTAVTAILYEELVLVGAISDAEVVLTDRLIVFQNDIIFDVLSI